MPELTEEQKKDSQERLQKFMSGYEQLVKDTDYDFANYPVYMPDGEGAFKTLLQTTPIDKKYVPTPSPFVAGQ